MALPDVLLQLLDDGVIDDVKGRLMSGKEASVFIVERDGHFLAAKVYKEREQRTFKATADYTEGRNQTRNSRDKRAMGKRSRYGKELVEESWRDMEYRALNEAFDAGVRVPEPVLLYENVLLMELLVDEHGDPASRLAEFELTAEVAELLFLEIYGQIRLLLASGKVHGDLSAFNILITHRGPTIIDLPQVVDAAGNSKAADILRRDVKNIVEHLARFAPSLLRFRDTGDALWRHFQRGTLDRALEPEEGGERQMGKRGRPPRRGVQRAQGRPEPHAGASRLHQGHSEPPTSAPRPTGRPGHHAGPQDRSEHHAGAPRPHGRPGPSRGRPAPAVERVVVRPAAGGEPPRPSPRPSAPQAPGQSPTASDEQKSAGRRRRRRPRGRGPGSPQGET